MRSTNSKLTSALLVTFTALLFTLQVKAQYFEQSGSLLYALNHPNRQVFDISPDGKLAVALKNDPTSVHPAMLTTFDPVLGTQFDSKSFGFGPLNVRLAKVGSNLRAVVQTSEGGPRKIFLFDVSPTGQLTEIASTQLTSSGADNGSNLMLSGNGAVGFVIVATDAGADVISFSLNTGAIIKRFPVSSAPDTIALYENPNARLLVFRLGIQLKVLNMLDPSQPVEIASVPLVTNSESSGSSDDGIAFGGDGRYVFFANQFFDFAAIDLDTKKVVGTIPGANLRFRFVESFEGAQQRLLAVSALPSGTVNTSALLIVDATNPSQLAVLNNVSPVPGQYFKFSNDGSRLIGADDTGLRAFNLPGLATAWEKPAPASALRVHQLQVYGAGNEVMGAWSVSGTATSLFGAFPAFPPNVALGDSTTVNENGGTTASFTVTLSAPTAHRVTVNYTTSGTAQAGSDFTSPSGSVVIEPGATSGTINIPIIDDTLDEPDETIDLNITSNIGIVTTAQSTVTIVDNDPPPSASIEDASVFEGTFFTNFVVFQVTLSAASGHNISLAYSTVPDTATATDFTISSGTLTIPAGETFGSIVIPITPDSLSENDEAFSLSLSNPTNVALSKTAATGTIINDDAPEIARPALSQRAIALDAVLLTTEPFALNNPNYFGQEKRTRINVFSLNMILTPGLVITAEGIDSQQVVHQLPVEFVGNVAGFNAVVPQEPFLTQIVLRLPDGITSAGDLQVRISARGRNSNQVLIAVKP